MTVRSLRALLAAATALVLAGCMHGPAPAPASNHDAFFSRLLAMCGKAYAGRIEVDVPAAPGNDAFAGKPLVMHVRDCGSDTVRIPFHVGDDR